MAKKIKTQINKTSDYKLQPILSFEKYRVAILIFILFATFVAYFSIRNHEFTNWDDNEYIVNNQTIQSTDLQSTFKHFTSFQGGNYHPLTMISYAINYYFSNTSPPPYLFTNVLIHLINIVLVFLLFKSITTNDFFSLLVALIFAIHPLRIESVAWASERKDVLYALFFLSSLIYWLKFRDSHKNKDYFVSLLLFILSCLSKSMAMTLPLIIIVLDYIKVKKQTRINLILKIPFFLIAIITGVLAIISQKESGAMNISIDLSIFDKILVVCYAILFYPIKLILPISLSSYYPYPNSLGILYYLSFLSIIVLIFLGVKYKWYNRKMFTGILFYIFAILPVLQIIQVGQTPVADRYSYIPLLGLMLMLFYILERKLNMIQFKQGIVILCIVLILGFWLTNQRIQVWKTSETLWTDVIVKYPNVALAYNNRGIYLAENQRNTESINDFKKAVSIQPNDAKTNFNLGNNLLNLGMLDEAEIYLRKAVLLNVQNPEIFLSLGICKQKQKNTKKAIEYFTKAISINPNYEEAYVNRAGCFTQINDTTSAKNDYKKALTLNPASVETWYNQSVLLIEQKKYNEAIQMLNRVINMNENHTMALINRGLSKVQINDLSGAIADLSKAIEVEPNNASAYLNRGLTYMKTNEKIKACEDWSKAANLNHQKAKNLLSKYCK